MGKKKIVVIDDSETIRKLLKEGLEAGGYEVRTAETAEAGALLMDEDLPDLVVMDVNLPGDCQGNEACHLIKISPGGRDLPFILISDMPKEQLARMAENAYANAFLQKPFDPEVLVTILDEHFGG